MGSLWLKIKIWTKITVAVLLTIYVLIFVMKNGGRTAQFWYWFNRDVETSLLFLVMYAFLVGVITTVLVGTALRTLRQIRELRSRNRSERLEAEIADMKTKAAMLQTRGSNTESGAAPAGRSGTFITPSSPQASPDADPPRGGT